MANALLLVALALWLAAAILALGGALTVSRVALAVGAAAGVAAAAAGLPDASEAVTLPGRLAGEAVDFRIAPQGLWLMGFGLVPAIFACSLASPTTGGGEAGSSAPRSASLARWACSACRTAPPSWSPGR